MKEGETRGWFPAASVALLLAMAPGAGAGQDPSAATLSADELTANHPRLGQEAPTFELPSTDGRSVALTGFRHTKFVVIHFATSW